MKRCANRLGIGWVALVCWSLFAAEHSPTWGASLPAQRSFQVWRVEDGWQQNTVTAIVQTRDGYLWLGTYHGLVRFDGVRFSVFDTSNSPGLQNSIVNSLYEDPSGVLWVGHETGELTRYVNGEFQPVPLGETWRGGAIETISADEQGDLWLLNDTGFLFRLRDGLSAQAPGVASPSRKPWLTRGKNGKLWLVSNGVVATLEHGKVSPFAFDKSPASDFFEKVLPAQDGGLWVLGNGRLRRWRDGNWVGELRGCPREPGAVTVLWETRAGDLLAGTLKDGVYVLSAVGGALHFDRTDGLSHAWVRALCEDHEGNIWLGTGAGVDALRPRKVQMLDAPDHFQGCGVLSFTVLEDGSAWIGTEGAGLYHYEANQWTNYGEANGLANAFVWSVLETQRGGLIVGTWGGGLFVRDGERFATQGALINISAPALALYEGKRGEVWIGTTRGLHRYRAGQLTWSAGTERLTLPDVRAITESSDGTLWFGMSGGGLGSLQAGVLKQFRKADGLASDFVLCLYADSDGALWFGTSDHGLGRWKDGRFASISTAQGLSSSVISQILDDGAGNLWLGSHRGILRVSKGELNRCADGAATSIGCLSYGTAEGLAARTCSGGFQPGACRTADGRLWFPTAKGLAIVDPAKVSPNTVPPPVVIEELSVEGQAVTLRAPPGRAEAPARLRIPPGRQRFELAYTALSFAAPDKVRFKYKLEGLERDWRDAATKRVAQYSYLPPGNYTFRVIACNNDGFWNETGASLAFTVLPYFWQTWWFRAGALSAGAIGVGALVFWVSRRRVRRKLELLERQRALERERARIARDIHDELGASLTRITLLSQSVRGELEAASPTAVDADQIYSTARELTRSMDEIVWAVDPRHDTLDSLVTYLGRFAQNYLSAAAIRCRLDVPVNLPPWGLTAEIRHNLFLAFKEALHNVVKHATASEVRVSLELVAQGFVLLLVDNGRGFDWGRQRDRAGAAAESSRLAPGNGLRNMQLRLEEIGGTCEWITAPEEGTRVRLSVRFRP